MLVLKEGDIMILREEEAKNIGGYFKEYEYRYEVIDGGFKRTHYNSFYARNDESARVIFEGMVRDNVDVKRYRYSDFNPTGLGDLSASYLVERINCKEKLLMYVRIDNKECIQ